MDQKAVQKIGKYEVVAELGEGGMGVVYKARDPIIGRLVAIKTITPDLVSDPEILKRFYREAQSAGTLQHPNIVTIHDLGEEEGCPYIVMEFVEGESLKEIINRRSKIPLATKLKLAQQFCEGLSHAHKNGFVHRDVKPANILVTKAGIVKVVDFGIVHLDTTTLTKTGTFLGTVHYASPEQVNDGRVDSRSDLWSVVCVMYELIAYKKPFDGSTITAVIAKILNLEPEPLSHCSPDSPPELDSVISKGLKKNPEGRYQSLDELLGDLLPIAHGLQMSFIGGLLGEAADLRSKGDLSGAQEKVRVALYLDNTHSEAKRLQSEITADFQRLPPEVKAKKLVADAELAFNRGEYAAAIQALGEAQKLHPLDAQARELQDKALRQGAQVAAESGLQPPTPGGMPGVQESTSVMPASPLAPQPRPKAKPLAPPAASQKPAKRAPMAGPTPQKVAPAPARALKKETGGKLRRAVVAVAALAIILAIGGFLFLRYKGPSGPTTEETRLESEARILQATGNLQGALAKWQELANKQGTLKDEADEAVATITKKMQQEKDLFDRARAAEKQKNWDEAISLYQNVAALNGPLKDQATQAITIDMQLQRGIDLSQIEQQTYQQADSALKSSDYTLARGLFQNVISMRVPNSTLAPKAQAALSNIDQLMKSKGAFDAAERAENSGDLKDALAQFQKIAEGSGPWAAQAKARIPKLNDKISNVAAQQAFNGAVQTENRGDLNGALAQFKALAAKPGAFSQDAQTHIQQINDKLSGAAAKQQFDAADRAQSAGDLKGALAQFKALAESPGPLRAQAQARAAQVAELIAEANRPKPEAPKPSPPPPPLTHAPAPAGVGALVTPRITVNPSGECGRWTLPVQNGMMVPDYNVDGCPLKPLNLSMAPVSGAPPNSYVLIKIDIDQKGNVTSGIVMSDNGMGPQVSEAAKSWKFTPPTVKGKPVRTSTAVKVTF